MRNEMIDKERIYSNLIRMVKEPSVSGTCEEIKGALIIEELLFEIPYFKENPDLVMRVPLKDDPYDRFLISAFLPAQLGDGEKVKDTIILTGHYDVVDVEDFGKLKDFAYEPEAITERIGQMPMDEKCRADLESGDWLFGRGVADMKYGNALCLELLKHYSEEGGIKANLLYVAVCGEETNSEGMLGSLPFFNSFAKEKDLTYRLLLLTECFMVDRPDDGTKFIQYGATGKIMPMFFCVGAATHGEEPLLGLDANLINGEIYRRMHINPVFCQQSNGITTAPPAGLKLQDLKANYSLSTSLYAVSYYNIATVKLQPEELMDQLLAVAEEAFASTVSIVEKNIEGFAKLAGRQPEAYKIVPRVMTYKALYESVKATYEGDLDQYLRDYAKELMAQNPEIQNTCVYLVKQLYELCEEKGPVIIVSLLPPYYPDVNIDREDADTCRMLACNEKIIQYAKEQFGETLATSEYYGISDLCYTWLADGMDFDRLFDNLVGLNAVYNFPGDEMKQFKVPGVVFGGYGKDFHKYTERLNRDYNFRVLPELYLKYIEYFMEED